MQDRGTPGRWLPEKEGGEIHQKNIDEVWVECRSGDQYAEAREADRKFRFLRTLDGGREVSDDAGEIVARYVKFIYHLVTQPKNAGKKVAILSRTNHLYHLRDLSLFLCKLKSCFTREQVQQMGGRKAIDRNFQIGTAHSFKGLQAHIVFLVRACQGAFPLLHPDYVLFKLFGDSDQEILEDERRLFYVAVTRAKEQVWFLTETDRESDFVSALMETMEPSKSVHRTEYLHAAQAPRR
jgi:superfamily I DNA/RNA helicase